jgi:hypothetical protein
MKAFKSLFYTGLMIVMLPVFLFLMMVILPVFFGIKDEPKEVETKDIVLIYDTVEVKKVIYDTVKPKKKFVKKKEEETKVEVESDSTISD